MSNMMQFNGEQVKFAVSPCSWMYLNYGLQVQVWVGEHTGDAGSKFINDKTIAATELPRQNLNAIALGMIEKWLAENGTAPLHDAVRVYEEADAKFKAEEAKEQKRAEARQARQDARQKAKGYTHRVDMWIHPARGDDYQATAYVVGTPDEVVISKLLRSSRIKTDYTVVAL
jgi:hypothetical protein